MGFPSARGPGLLVLTLALLGVGALISTCPAQEFIRGDVNNDFIIDIGDAIFTLDFLFVGGEEPGCLKAADCNDDGAVDVADPTYLIFYLFVGGDPPEPPFPSCGDDPSADVLTCDESAACQLGGPLDGLDLLELQAFSRGRDLMLKRFAPSEGLGPFYNTTSCVNCHETPTVGGSASCYRNFLLVGIGEEGEQGPIQDPLLPSLVLPSYGALDGPRPNIPASGPSGEPVTVAHRNAPPMFGVGLFEFIHNVTITANADPDDLLNPDGISGRYNTDGLGHIGRFGYKLQANFIEPFIRGAANNQMGITSDAVLGSDGVVFWMKQVMGPLDLPITDADAIPDPEISVEDMADLIAFSKFLRPPKKKPFGPDETLGEILFADAGCTGCHIPSLPSDLGPVEAYTDLLLHDMGPELADGISLGVPQAAMSSPDTTGSEFRTQPLWGVSLHRPWLHDGRADTLHEAILLHGGEATASRINYENLTPADQMALIRFLEAL